MENKVLSFEEMKEMFPNEWILLGNPLIEQTKVLSGIPIYHAPDKRDIAASGIKWRDYFESATMVFTGEFPKNRRIWL
jgi:hypothetical protein